ncbi:MAG: hypothetical protein ACLP01_29360 [Solirubrobacteraceae bacterium]
MQHGRAGDAKGPHRVDDGDVARWGVFDEDGAELVPERFELADEAFGDPVGVLK